MKILLMGVLYQSKQTIEEYKWIRIYEVLYIKKQLYYCLFAEQ